MFTDEETTKLRKRRRYELHSKSAFSPQARWFLGAALIISFAATAVGWAPSWVGPGALYSAMVLLLASTRGALWALPMGLVGAWLVTRLFEFEPSWGAAVGFWGSFLALIVGERVFACELHELGVGSVLTARRLRTLSWRDRLEERKRQRVSLLQPMSEIPWASPMSLASPRELRQLNQRTLVAYAAHAALMSTTLMRRAGREGSDQESFERVHGVVLRGTRLVRQHAIGGGNIHSARRESQEVQASVAGLGVAPWIATSSSVKPIGATAYWAARSTFFALRTVGWRDSKNATLYAWEAAFSAVVCALFSTLGESRFYGWKAQGVDGFGNSTDAEYGPNRAKSLLVTDAILESPDARYASCRLWTLFWKTSEWSSNGPVPKSLFSSTGGFARDPIAVSSFSPGRIAYALKHPRTTR